jgi:alpha-L-rhamnosidase
MAFPISMYQYYLYSGDLAFVSQEWPLVQREISWQNSLVDSGGLVATTTDGLDWNLDPHVGDYTYYNALHYEALRDAAVLAGALGRTGLGTTYLHQAEAVKAVINANLWNPNLGAYDAATSPAERGFYVQDANAEAVLSGIAPPDRARSVMTHLAANLTSPYGMPNVTSTGAPDYTAGANGVLISPYVGSFTVQADFAARTDELAYALIQQEWGHMINNDPGGVDWEKIHTDGTLASGDSAAHGWSTGATSALSQYALGASPSTPGYATYLVEPHPGGGLSWVEGQVPTSNGPLGVNWGYDALNSRFQLQTEAPPGSSGTVSVPLLGAPRVITEDGKVVWDGSRPVGALSTGSDGQYVRIMGVTGTHLWSWAPAAAAATPPRAGPQSGNPNTSGQSVAPFGSASGLAILCIAAVRGRRRRASSARRCRIPVGSACGQEPPRKPPGELG